MPATVTSPRPSPLPLTLSQPAPPRQLPTPPQQMPAPPQHQHYQHHQNNQNHQNHHNNQNQHSHTPPRPSAEAGTAAEQWLPGSRRESRGGSGGHSRRERGGPCDGQRTRVRRSGNRTQAVAVSPPWHPEAEFTCSNSSACSACSADPSYQHARAKTRATHASVREADAPAACPENACSPPSHRGMGGVGCGGGRTPRRTPGATPRQTPRQTLRHASEAHSSPAGSHVAAPDARQARHSPSTHAARARADASASEPAPAPAESAVAAAVAARPALRFETVATALGFSALSLPRTTPAGGHNACLPSDANTPRIRSARFNQKSRCNHHRKPQPCPPHGPGPYSMPHLPTAQLRLPRLGLRRSRPDLARRNSRQGEAQIGGRCARRRHPTASTCRRLGTAFGMRRGAAAPAAAAAGRRWRHGIGCECGGGHGGGRGGGHRACADSSRLAREECQRRRRAPRARLTISTHSV